MIERKELTNGARWMRFIPLIPVPIFILQVFFQPSLAAQNAVLIALCVVLFHLGKSIRCLHFDDRFLYKINGQREEAIEFSKVISMKASATRVQGSRYWVLKYLNALGKEKTMRFFQNNPFSELAAFQSALREANPDVVIWDHPHFHD